MQLLVATHNKGKVAEINALLSEAGITCLTLDEAGVTFDVEENADTFIGNATLKATQYAEATGLLTLADDSGLEVAALDNQPGVYTARYGGSHLTQPERNQYLLNNLMHVDGADRAATFRCVMVLAAGDGSVIGSEAGQCPGQIAHAPIGTHGFGYDPIFFVPERNATLAQLTKAEKQTFSHRGNALRAILPLILKHITK